MYETELDRVSKWLRNVTTKTTRGQRYSVEWATKNTRPAFNCICRVVDDWPSGAPGSAVNRGRRETAISRHRVYARQAQQPRYDWWFSAQRQRNIPSAAKHVNPHRVGLFDVRNRTGAQIWSTIT